MWLRFLIAIAFIALVLGPLVFVKSLQFSALAASGAAFEEPAEAVSVSEVRALTWERSISAVGNVVAVQGTMLEAELPGIVREIHFENGQAVAKGDKLIELDTSVELAELEAAEATTELARAQFTRAQNLVATQAAPQSTLDLARAELRQAEAAIENIRAVIARKFIRAPFAGQVGIRQVNIGQFVNTGTRLVSLQNVDPIFVDFQIPQQRIDDLRRGLSVEARPDPRSGESFTGSVQAINPDVDPRTRSVIVQALFENPKQRLRPGMFVRTEVTLDEPREVMAIPATAIIAAPYGDSVYLVRRADDGDHLVAEQKFVRTGERRGDWVEILGGLTVGDEVVSSGGFKLRNNSRIRISPHAAPDAQKNPEPTNS